MSQQGTSEFMVASVARWGEHARMLMIHQQKCKKLSLVVEDMSERQDAFGYDGKAKRMLQRAALDELHKQIFQEIQK